MSINNNYYDTAVFLPSPSLPLSPFPPSLSPPPPLTSPPVLCRLMSEWVS